MKKVLSFFSQPYPLEESVAKQWTISLITACGLVLAFFIIKPFNLGNVSYTNARMILVYAGYGAVTFTIRLLADRFIRPAFPRFFSEPEWTVLKNIAWIVFITLLIALGVLFYSNILGFYGVSGTSLLLYQLDVLKYSIVPAFLFTLIRSSLLEKRNRRFMDEIHYSLNKPLKVEDESAMVEINSTEGSENLLLETNRFLYAESAGNYTDVVYVESGIVKRALIRTPLGEFVSLFSGQCVARVNTSFVVNLCKVREVVGNAQGFRLFLEFVEESVPVSRGRREWVKNRLAALHP